MKQITEDYVSFEIARLLKEKGFDELSTVFYNEDGTDLIELYDYEPLRNSEISGYARVTQSLALKWLREVHHLSIDVFASHYCFEYTIAVLPQGTIIRDIESGFHNTYEQAVEAACLYVLKNLI